MLSDNTWFTEAAPAIGTAFSLSIESRLHAEQTQYQFLEIYQTTHFGNLMVLDGCTMLSQRDNFIYHEMMTHPALFSHPAPKQVAIIGGGDCGSLREVLKHACIKKVWQIDIDERVTRNAEKYFPELCTSNTDPRAELLFIDGIQWMERAASASLDLIIVDSTDPVGPAKGLFSEAFYRTCQRALGEHGLLIQQSESPLVHSESIIYPMHDAMLTAGFSTTQTLFFPLPIYPTGWWSATMASKQTQIEFIRKVEADKKLFSTDYYNSSVHEAAFTAPEFFRAKFAGRR
ncbi:MAG: polyamine aminopropyltransferase [Gammaproteobacteria bacterium]|nr:polyamine aminopropyltransferase [Gammaproteobacteria bacterium]